jgi:hypothetical protein
VATSSVWWVHYQDESGRWHPYDWYASKENAQRSASGLRRQGNTVRVVAGEEPKE